MVFKASSSKEIDALLADLASERGVARDAAVARLTVIGSRAVDKLLALVKDVRTSGATRAAALRTLEGIADPRALGQALTSVADPDVAVATAAIGVARAFLGTSKGDDVLDRLTAIALDRQRQTSVRLAAIHALSEISPSTMDPVLATLGADPDAEVAATANRGGLADSHEQVRRAAEGVLPDDPAVLGRALRRRPVDVSVLQLQQIVDRVRLREDTEPFSGREEWMAVRAAAHAALAEQGSRLALYDLRETMEGSTTPLPVEFLAALTLIGDATCVEPVVATYARARAEGRAPNEWWLRHLADSLRAIVRREKLTRRHAVIKKVDVRWPGVFQTMVDGT